MLFKDKKKAQHKKKQRFVNRIRRDLELDAQVAPSRSMFASMRDGAKNGVQRASNSVAQLIVTTHVTILFMLDSIARALGAVVMTPIYFLAYCGSIMAHSTVQFVNRENDEEVMQQDALQERMRNLERAFASLQNKHIKLMNKMALQEKQLLDHRPVTKVVHIHQKSTSTAPVASVPKAAPPPPPPMALLPPPPPPPMGLPPIPAPRKLNIIKRANNISGIIKPPAPAGSSGISLASVLGARNALKKATAQPEAPIKKLPQPGGFGVSLSDISSIQLRRVSRPANGKPRIGLESPSRQAALFRLRSTAVPRSPGGTPMKENIAINEDSPANVLTSALKRKFRHARNSPSRSPSRSPRKSSLPPSPYESPNAKLLAMR